MKTAHNIIHNISKTRTFSCLQKKIIITQFFEQFFPSLAHKIHFVKKDNNILSIALKHPAHLIEFNYNLKTIKATLKAASLKPDGSFKLLENIVDIKVFVSHFAFNMQEAEQATPYTYEEHSKGAFENLATSPKIAAIFEEIRNIIHAHHRLQQCVGEDDFYRRINQ